HTPALAGRRPHPAPLPSPAGNRAANHAGAAVDTAGVRFEYYFCAGPADRAFWRRTGRFQREAGFPHPRHADHWGVRRRGHNPGNSWSIALLARSQCLVVEQGMERDRTAGLHRLCVVPDLLESAQFQSELLSYRPIATTNVMSSPCSPGLNCWTDPSISLSSP